MEGRRAGRTAGTEKEPQFEYHARMYQGHEEESMKDRCLGKSLLGRDVAKCQGPVTGVCLGG